jgi:hypothetical protein
MNMSSILAALAAIESQVGALRSVISTEAKPVAATKSKKASAKQAAVVDPDAPVKPKREINPKIAAMNDERKVIYAEMKGAWSAANPSFAAMESAELKKAIAEGQVVKPPSFPDAIKEHSRRLRENDPAAEARHQTYLAKRAKKDAAAPPAAPAPAVSTKQDETETVASGNSSDSKGKRGPKPGFKLSDEEKAKRSEKRKQNAAAKKMSGLPPLPSSPVSDA